MTLRALPIRRVGNRSPLFLGGDREIVMSAGAACLILFVIAADPVAATAAILMWFTALHLARMMAKKDPLLRQVYLRHRQYRTYYPARSTPSRRNSSQQARRYA